MSGEGFDPRRFKSLERAGFNRIAARYADGAHLRADLAAALLDAAELAPGQHVLDLASGPGLLACDAALQVGASGYVVATDIADAMLAEGRRRQREFSGGVTALGYAAADAEHLGFADGRFDRVLAGLALFMFPHPEQALAEMRRVLRPGGCVALSVWGEREQVPLIGRAQDCIARLLPAPRVPRPSVFRFGEPGQLEAVLTAAGFAEVRVLPCRFTCRFDDPGAYWQAFLDLAGGAAESLARLPESLQSKLRDEVTEELLPHRSPDGAGYAVDATALVATARKP